MADTFRNKLCANFQVNCQGERTFQVYDKFMGNMF